MRKTLVWSCALLLTAHPVPAQALHADSLFDRLVGNWVLRGTIAGQQTTHDVTFQWMLGRAYKYSATTRFHTTFVYSRASDSWQWHMDNDSAGVRRPFARVTLTRRY